jgi:hypothetical protein
MKLPELPEAENPLLWERSFGVKAMQDYGQACYDKALEDAAKKFEDMQTNGNTWISTVAASAATRALKDSK